MKLTKTKRIHSVGFNMTPMIDIVFLLIIFFMTVSQITRVVDQPLTLPIVNSGAKESVTVSVTINVTADGTIVVGGKTYSLQRIAELLKARLASTGNDTNQIKIEVRCDKRCSSEQFNPIIKKLSDLGFQYTRFAVSGEN